MHDGKEENVHREYAVGPESTTARVATSSRTTQHPTLTSKITPYVVFFSLWVALGGLMVNFDIGYSGTVLNMEPFNRAFGSCQMVPASSIPQRDLQDRAMVQVCALSATAQSVGSSIHLLFMALGNLMSAFVSDFFGRRGTIQLGCLIAAVGAAGMLGSVGNFTAYVVCKCIGAVGIGYFQVMAPTYGVECTPPRIRGLLVALYSVESGLGYFFVALVCLGSSKLQTTWAWQTPIIIQIPLAAIYAGGIQFFPESPRWLLTKGKEEKARQSFGRFYREDAHSEKVTAQVQEVGATIEMEKAMSPTTSPVDIFRRSSLRRTLTAVLILTSASLSGAFAIFTYAAILLSSIGISNPFMLNVVINALTLAGESVGPFAVEYLGRRRTLMAGYAGMSSCMLIFAAISSRFGQGSSTAQNAVIAFLCLWSIIFGATVASAMWLTAAELHSVRLRTYGQSFAVTMNSVFIFAVNFWTPYMINKGYGNLGTNIGYFYFALEFLALIGTYLMVPETSRLTLEQIDDFFVSGGKAWKTSISKNKNIAAGNTEADSELK